MVVAVAIWPARGKIFSDRSELSVRNSCMPPTPRYGSMAIAMTMIPTPPAHCSMPRHSRMPCGIRSRPTITVEPVVVRPETVSNTASATLSPRCEKTKGSAPTPEMMNQLNEVSRKPCRISSLMREPVVTASNSMPMKSDVAAARVKLCQSGLSPARSTAAGTSIASPMAVMRSPSTKPTGRKNEAVKRCSRPDGRRPDIPTCRAALTGSSADCHRKRRKRRPRLARALRACRYPPDLPRAPRRG